MRKHERHEQAKIRVLIVDDSAVVRQTLTEVLSSDPAIEVIGTAAIRLSRPSESSEQMPDVITLDIEMPRMDGLTFLQKIMSQHPIPVVICSSLAEEGAESTLQGAGVWGRGYHRQAARGQPNSSWRNRRAILCQAVKAAAVRACALRPRGARWSRS